MRLNAPFGAQCFPTHGVCVVGVRADRVSMHLLVLSAFRRRRRTGSLAVRRGSQCTFWCSVLSDLATGGRGAMAVGRLNAPFGAQCFPTLVRPRSDWFCYNVSMHLLVLSAFRLRVRPHIHVEMVRSQCTFWCSVLSDAFPPRVSRYARGGLNAPFGAQCFPTTTARLCRTQGPMSQCTFWCSVLSDVKAASGGAAGMEVSMHLLVLSAFRRGVAGPVPDGDQESQCTFWCSVLSDPPRPTRPAAASPSQCTFWCSVLSDGRAGRARRSRPRWSQCTFWCSVLSDASLSCRAALASAVSMHLLVLSAFRPDELVLRLRVRRTSQCTFWCSVLSDRVPLDYSMGQALSQCTFWCSVLSDGKKN